MLKFRLFGKGEAVFDNQSLACFPNQQPYLLLCYLLLNANRPHARDQVAALFWSEYSTAVSRKYLRNGLWRLRTMFETVGAIFDEFLSVTDDSISFIPSRPYWLDIEAFVGNVQRCQDVPGRLLSADQAAALQDAVALYTGDLLDGIYEDWCIYDRERFSLLYLNALTKLMEYHETHGNYEHGLDYGARFLLKDPTHEQVYHQMMRFYWQLGDRSAALAQYKRCVQVLKEELGVAPLKEITDTYHRMAHNQYEPSSPLIPVTNTPLETTADVMEQALHQIRRLETVITEANEELHKIEALIHRLRAAS